MAWATALKKSPADSGEDERSGGLFGWFTPVIFSGFNRVYGWAEGGYGRGLAWVLSHRTLIMGGLLASAVVTPALADEDEIITPGMMGMSGK